MAGDNLNLLLFFASTAAAGAMGAIATNGVRSRVLWGTGLAGLVACAACLYADSASPVIKVFRAGFVLSPFIGVALALLVSGGRKPLERRPPAASGPPILNPALTIEHLNAIVKGSTTLEAKRKLAAHANQIARIKAQVDNIEESWGVVTVRVRGIDRDQWDTPLPMTFRKSQADVLEVIKPGDWIEFTGKVEHSSVYGWTLTDCEFVARADPPAPLSSGRRRKTP